MYTVYILQSLKNKRYYIGHCEDMETRLKVHNTGRVQSTKHGVPWRVVFSEQYSTRGEARSAELQIKRYKGGIQFRALLDGTIRKR